MNKEELEEILKSYGIKRFQDEKYYLNLAFKFLENYIEIFTKEKIFNLKHSYNSVNDSRLAMDGLFNSSEIKDLSFDDEHIFYINGKPLFSMNLKKQVKKVWTQGIMQSLVYLVNVESFLDTLNDFDKLTLYQELEAYQEQYEFLSYFYRYVLALLEENKKTQFDSIRIGCFTNAYFDIINYKRMELVNRRNI